MDFPTGIRPKRGHIQIRYTVNGKRYEETLELKATRTGVADAIRIRRERIRARKYGLQETEVGFHPFEQVAQAYLDSAELALSTHNSYRDALNIYWHALRGRDVSSITLTELVALDDAIRWPGRKTRSNALIPLRQVFRHAVARGYASLSPAAGLTAQRRKSRSEPDPYSANERDTLLKWLRANGSPPSFEYFTVAFGTGMRTGELLALSWGDFTGEALYVHQARVRGELKGTKTDTPRRVIVLDEVVNVLRSMPRPIRGGAIFRNQYGDAYLSGYHLNRSFRKAHRQTGVRLRTGPYPWRHSYASVALSAGVAPALIAQQLGHSLSVLLSTYARWIHSGSDRDELAKMTSSGVQRTGNG